MKWITREHAKVDRIACPWLIKNFVDMLAIYRYMKKNEKRFGMEIRMSDMMKVAKA